MDRESNPYAPGAGSPPPELAGRDVLIEDARVALARVRRGLAAKSMLLIGLRGVGKTVLLGRMEADAVKAGARTMMTEAPEGRSLPGLIAPELRKVLLALSRVEKAKSVARRALAALSGFATSLKVKFKDIEVGLDVPAVPGLADNGNLEHDLPVLLASAAEAAQRADTAIALYVDELQYVKEEELAILITALHRTAQEKLPIILFGAGLPQLRGRMGNAKSYAERLFAFPAVGPLSSDEARRALELPARSEGVEFTDGAIARILDETKGYPYFLQEWGKHVWDEATKSPIDENVVKRASESAIAALDESFFRVRFDRLSPSERRYLRAMSELGEGPHRSGDIAAALGREVTTFAPMRNRLIEKGMIWSPGHGDTAFTVPLFDSFMRRIMPGEDWRG